MGLCHLDMTAWILVGFFLSNSTGFCRVTRKTVFLDSGCSGIFRNGNFCGCVWLFKRSQPAGRSLLIPFSWLCSALPPSSLDTRCSEERPKGAVFEPFPSHHPTFSLHERCAHVCDGTDVTKDIAGPSP